MERGQDSGDSQYQGCHGAAAATSRAQETQASSIGAAAGAAAEANEGSSARSVEATVGAGRQGPWWHAGSRSPVEPLEQHVKREKRYDGYKAATSSKASSGDASSLSIKETNKLRAKLGLKPLEVNAVKKDAGTKEEPMAADQPYGLATV
ncbi:U4 tri-snRNP-associated 1 [Sigmodon hispidus]